MQSIKVITKPNTEDIQQALKDNGGYCPCTIIKTPDTLCMCRKFREQMKRKQLGECHCGIFEIIEGE